MGKIKTSSVSRGHHEKTHSILASLLTDYTPKNDQQIPSDRNCSWPYSFCFSLVARIIKRNRRRPIIHTGIKSLMNYGFPLRRPQKENANREVLTFSEYILQLRMGLVHTAIDWGKHGGSSCAEPIRPLVSPASVSKMAPFLFIRKISGQFLSYITFTSRLPFDLLPRCSSTKAPTIHPHLLLP